MKHNKEQFIKVESIENVEKIIKQAVKNNQIIRLISYSMTEETEKRLDKILHAILEKANRLDLKDALYTCIKELIINGIKANAKRVFFQEKGLDINNEEDYEKGIQEFRSILTEKNSAYYGAKAKEKGYYVKVGFIYNQDGMRVEVINNSPVTPQEEKRLRQKMSQVMKYETLVDFYLENPDNTEGAGLGLALIVTLSKATGIDPSLFRIITQSECTTARIEVPFTDKYVPLRR